MTEYTAPIEDIKFVLNDLLDIHSHYQNYPDYQDVTPDDIDMILTECAKFCTTELAPLYQSGDREGCNWEQGKVTTPAGFKDAYQKYVDGAWQGISHPVEYDGQGLPPSIGLIVTEMIGTANWSWSMYPGLSLGAMNTLLEHGSEIQKKTYLTKLTQGTWSGTMCLTEAQCGSDLGLIRTRAEPADDGSYSVTGSKIFISAGEHDLTSNIIHIVLARLPDAPAGVRGISLFLVGNLRPYLPDWAGRLCYEASFYQHFERFSRGVLDSRDIVFFLAMTAVPLAASPFWANLLEGLKRICR